MAVEVALEVEVREKVALRDGEELLERSIRLDVVLVLEVVLLHVVVDTLRHLGTAHERTLGLDEEGAELIGHLDGALEDGGRTGLCIRALLRLNTALALAGVLDLAVDTAIEALDLAEERRGHLAERREARRENLEVLVERRGGAGCDGTCRLLNRRGRDDDGCGSNGSCRRSLGLLGLGLSGCCCGNGRDNCRNCNCYGLGLLGYLLDGGGGLGGGAHYTGG